jgi:restriction endonuclease Mrr
MVDALLDLTPTQFEEAVGAFLTAQGFGDVQRVGGAGDLGVDLRCTDEEREKKGKSRANELHVFQG